MDVRNMSELELNGVLFICFPDRLSLSESRERLELEIMFAAMEDGPTEVEEAEIGEDGKPHWTGRMFNPNEPCISPYWIVRALSKRVRDMYKAMKPEERREAIKNDMKKFAASRKKAQHTENTSSTQHQV